jgi:hypothetical protein
MKPKEKKHTNNPLTPLRNYLKHYKQVENEINEIPK